MNTCKKCSNAMYMSAMSQGKCSKCNKNIVTPHIPCYSYCDECAKELSICKQCGKPNK